MTKYKTSGVFKVWKKIGIKQTVLKRGNTGCLLNIVFFTLKFCDFSELCQFCCSAGVLPAWRVYTH